MGRDAVLPNNEEIEAALAERTRIFHSDSHPEVAGGLAPRRF